MKKIACFILCLVIIAALAGCSGSGSASRTSNQSAGVNDILESGMAAADESTDPAADESASKDEDQDSVSSGTVSADGADIDLTVMSSTMVYSEVFNMISKPDEYRGKIIKMKGLCSVYYSEETKKTYYSCIIKDATACCAQGIEFTLSEKYIEPDDYPENESEICIIGEYDTYKEKGLVYSTLKNAELLSQQ